jgi:hypothetical protein
MYVYSFERSRKLTAKSATILLKNTHMYSKNAQYAKLMIFGKIWKETKISRT